MITNLLSIVTGSNSSNTARQSRAICEVGMCRCGYYSKRICNSSGACGQKCVLIPR